MYESNFLLHDHILSAKKAPGKYLGIRKEIAFDIFITAFRNLMSLTLVLLA